MWWGALLVIQPPSLMAIYTSGPLYLFLPETFVRAFLVHQIGSDNIDPQNEKGLSLNPLPPRRIPHSYGIVPTP